MCCSCWTSRRRNCGGWSPPSTTSPRLDTHTHTHATDIQLWGVVPRMYHFSFHIYTDPVIFLAQISNQDFLWFLFIGLTAQPHHLNIFFSDFDAIFSQVHLECDPGWQWMWFRLWDRGWNGGIICLCLLSVLSSSDGGRWRFLQDNLKVFQTGGSGMEGQREAFGQG